MNRLWLALLVAAVVLSIAADIVLLGGWGYYAVFGFVATVVIVFVSKALGKLFVEQPEDYYELERPDA